MWLVTTSRARFHKTSHVSRRTSQLRAHALLPPLLLPLCQLDAGLLYKENFDDERKYRTNEHGEYLNDRFETVPLHELTQHPLSQYAKKQARLEKDRQRRETQAQAENKRAYEEWVHVKALRDRALQALALIHPPALPFSYRELVDASPRKRRDLLEDRDFQVVVGVGQGLKKIDRTLLKDYAKWCEKVTCPRPQPGEPGFTGSETASAKQPAPAFFPSFNAVAVWWDAFAPTACDVHCAAHSHVRDAFLKVGLFTGLENRPQNSVTTSPSQFNNIPRALPASRPPFCS